MSSHELQQGRANRFRPRWNRLIRLGLLATALLGSRAGLAEEVREWRGSYQSGGVPVSVEGFVPASGERRPVVFLLHGSGGLEQATGEVFRGMARSLAGRGYVALIPHYFESSGHPIGQSFTRSEHDAHNRAMADALKMLGEIPQADAGRIGVFGFSSGAGVAARWAVSEKRVRAIVSCASAIPATLPTLYLVGSMDAGVGQRDLSLATGRLEAAKIPYGSHIYRGEGHAFRPGIYLDAAKRTADFFDLHVAPPSPANAAPLKRIARMPVRATESSFESADRPVAVEVFTPEGEGKHPVVLIAHAENSADPLRWQLMQTSARGVARGGFVVLLPRYGAEGTVEDGQGREIEDAMAFAATLPGADLGRIGLVAYGSGVERAATVARTRKDIGAMVWCGRLGGGVPRVPTLLLVGATDRAVTSKKIEEFGRAMEASGTRLSVHRYRGVGARFRPVEQFDMSDRAASFLAEHLGDSGAKGKSAPPP